MGRCAAWCAHCSRLRCVWLRTLVCTAPLPGDDPDDSEEEGAVPMDEGSIMPADVAMQHRYIMRCSVLRC